MPWTQPIISSSAAFGGSSFTAKLFYQGGSWRDWVYQFFDSSRTSGSWESFGSDSHYPLWFVIYSPEPICITKFHTASISNQNVGFGTHWEIYGNDTNTSSTYQYIGQWSTSASTMYGAEFDIHIGNNRRFFKYYKIVIPSRQYIEGGAYFGGANIDITATYKVSGDPDYYNAWAANAPSQYFIKY